MGDITCYTNTFFLKAAAPTLHSLSSIVNPQAFLASWGGFGERFYCLYLCIWTVVLCSRSMTLRRPTVCSMWPWEEALKATVLSFWPIMTSASTVCGKNEITDQFYTWVWWWWQCLVGFQTSPASTHCSTLRTWWRSLSTLPLCMWTPLASRMVHPPFPQGECHVFTANEAVLPLNILTASEIAYLYFFWISNYFSTVKVLYSINRVANRSV